MTESAAVAEALRPAIFRLSRLLRRETGGSGMSPLQGLLLSLIEHNPGIGVTELARIEGLRGPTMSGHVKQLEVAGLISRSAPHADDRRRIGLVITADGRARLGRLRKERSDWLAAQLARLAPEALEAVCAAVEPLARLGSNDDLPLGR